MNEGRRAFRERSAGGRSAEERKRITLKIPNEWLEAAGSGNLPALKKMAKGNSIASAISGIGWTIGHVAATEGRWNVLNWWFKNGGNVNAVELGGLSIGHCLALNGKPELLKKWAGRKGDLNVRTKDGATIGHVAAMSKNGRKMVEAWKKLGGDIHARDKLDWTLGHKAAHFGNFDVVKWWVENGGDFETQVSTQDKLKKGLLDVTHISIWHKVKKLVDDKKTADAVKSFKKK